MNYQIGSMINYSDFISKNKSMIVAPAGFGKTHAIAECLKLFESGKQLILTHTHAGVAALKEKITNEGIISKRYHIETISGYALKYVKAFYYKKDLPEQKDGQLYWSAIMKYSSEIISRDIVKKIIGRTYAGLFVDEYQDCTLSQHNLIMLLSEILPIHIIGDPLQSIFGFNETPVKWADIPQEYHDNKLILTTPWRWKNTNCIELGDFLSEVRNNLINKSPINLHYYSHVKGLEIIQVKEEDLRDTNSNYSKKINSLLREKQILFINSDEKSGGIRKKFVQRFRKWGRIYLIEAIDQKDFYSVAEKIDKLSKRATYKGVVNIMIMFFTKAELNKWFGPTKIVKKIDEENNKLSLPIISVVDKLLISFCPLLFKELLTIVSKLPKINFDRKDMFYTTCEALSYAKYHDCSVYDAMLHQRNQLRIIGRKYPDKCVGTTLLTKGLEFDNVAILNAEKFDLPEHLYVAMTRASKNLIIFTNKMELAPYKS
jgi:hypothetical protein